MHGVHFFSLSADIHTLPRKMIKVKVASKTIPQQNLVQQLLLYKTRKNSKMFNHLKLIKANDIPSIYENYLSTFNLSV